MKSLSNSLAGELLRVDLTHNTINRENIDLQTLRQFLGGTGYATKLLWDELEPKTDPLSADNKLVLTTGILTASGCPGSDSLFTCFKSPLTGGWGEARCGGGMGVELKKAGFDVVVIEGSAKKPVYLWIHNGNAEIRPAEQLWGLLVPETQEIVKTEVGDKRARVLSIGPGGEKKILFANIMVENLRAMGRCGGGAVMGAKNLKAIALRGTKRIEVADTERMRHLIRKMTLMEREHQYSGLSNSSQEAPEATFRAGTASFLNHYDKRGEIPTKNAKSNTWGRGRAMYRQLKKYITEDEGCKNCVLRCGKRAKVNKGKWKTPLGLYPEYETMVGFGHYILNDDVEAIIHLNHLCNTHGIDTISCSNAIAFAMEGYESGWITKAESGGLALNWGDMDAALKLVEMILDRKGLGDILAEGVRRAADKIGRGSSDAAMHVKGLELPGHDIRNEAGGKAWAIQYGTGSRGMCHSHPHEPVIVNACKSEATKTIGDVDKAIAPYTEKGKGKIIKWAQDYGSAINAMGLCNFHTYLVPASDPQRYTQVIAAATGLEISFDQLMTIGERVSTLQRCFNVREGFSRKDDLIPQRLMQVPAFGPFSEREETAINDYEAMLDEYYNDRGWDLKTGAPLPWKLKQLGL
jgi:aldehyde:ferredoxin oxidoreductase